MEKLDIFQNSLAKETFLMFDGFAMEQAKKLIKDYLIDIGVDCAFLVDMIGNIIVQCDNGYFDKDITLLAALASANSGAVNTIAKAIGERRFSFFLHKGKHESVHFMHINDECVLVTTFGSHVPLGYLRMRLDLVRKEIKKILWSHE